MTAREALKISILNAGTEFNDIMRLIENASKHGKVKIVLGYDVYSVGKLLDLGYDYSYYSGPEGIKATISWECGRDKRREDDNF